MRAGSAPDCTPTRPTSLGMHLRTSRPVQRQISRIDEFELEVAQMAVAPADQRIVGDGRVARDQKIGENPRLVSPVLPVTAERLAGEERRWPRQGLVPPQQQRW